MPIAGIAPRTRGYIATVLRRERLVALLLACLAAAIAFEPRIRAGGFNADDWALYAASRFPQTEGYHTALAALEGSAGSRVGHMLYWLASFSVFGGHTRLYTAEAALLAVIMAFAIYAALRELRFSKAESLAMMLLTIVLPSLGAERFWFTPAGLQICLALFFFGFVLALRAFSAPQRSRMRLHAASLALYIMSAAYAEAALPLMTVALLVYLTRTDLRTALRRWACDMAIVVAGYAATLMFVEAHAGFEKLPASLWLEHANLIAGQALTIFTKSLGPPAAVDRTLGIAVVGVVATSAFVLWRRGNVSVDSRRELRRWGYASIVCLVAITAGYAVFVPAMLYYEPLGPGLATHINIVTAAPLAVALFSVLMLARVVVREILHDVIPLAPTLGTLLVVVWYGAIFASATGAVRHDARIWAAASERDDHVLSVLSTDLPHPVPHAVIYTFGEAGTVAPGMPIFFTSWEQNNAVKIAYNRADISSYPIVSNGLVASCTKRGVTVKTGVASVGPPAPYGRVYFFDIPTGHFELINNFTVCKATMPRFPSGPYTTPDPFEWEL